MTSLPQHESDLLVFVHADLAVLSGDRGQLNADVAVLVPAEEARLGHQGEHGAVHPGPLDDHHGPVERHLDDLLMTSATTMTAVSPVATVFLFCGRSLYVTQASFPLVLRAPPPPPALVPVGLHWSWRKGGRVEIKRAFLL